MEPNVVLKPLYSRVLPDSTGFPFDLENGTKVRLILAVGKDVSCLLGIVVRHNARHFSCR
jgi:hypothetical protein